MKIITAEEQHFNVIKQIAYETWPHTFGNILSTDQIGYMLKLMYDVNAITKQVVELGHTFILAAENNAYYGYASYEVNYKQHPVTKIHKLYILPNVQGKGIGKMLIEYVESEARRNHNQHLTLNVNRENKAVEFYERMGFIKQGEEDIDIGKGFLMQDAVMQKQVLLF